MLAVACGDDDEEEAAPTAAPTAAAPVTKALNVGLVADTDSLGPGFHRRLPGPDRYML